MKQSITVSQLKAQAANLDIDGALVVTQNGKAKYVIEDFESYERRQEAMALLKIAASAKSDIQAGRTKSGQEITDTLNKMRPEPM